TPYTSEDFAGLTLLLPELDPRADLVGDHFVLVGRERQRFLRGLDGLGLLSLGGENARFSVEVTEGLLRLDGGVDPLVRFLREVVVGGEEGGRVRGAPVVGLRGGDGGARRGDRLLRRVRVH